jgi:ABC-type microcin C transport system permease subunit YejE
MTQTFTAKFNKNRRGYFSFIILATLFLITIFAEFLANDRLGFS